MGWYNDRVLPRYINRSCGSEALDPLRARVAMTTDATHVDPAAAVTRGSETLWHGPCQCGMIHAMSLRDERRDDTRRRIVDAVAALLVDESPAALSVPEVARRSGVSVRTIYRYFPDKERLVRSVAELGDPATVVGLPDPSGRDLADYLRRAWDDNIQRPHLRAQLRTTEGQEVRAARRRAQRPFIDQVLDAWDLDLDPTSARRLVDVLQLLTGAATLVELTDVLGESTDEAASVAAWTVQAVLEHARRTRALPGPDDDFEITPSTPN